MPLDNLSSDSSSVNESVVLQSGYTSSASITSCCELENSNILVNTTQLPPSSLPSLDPVSFVNSRIITPQNYLGQCHICGSEVWIACHACNVFFM